MSDVYGNGAERPIAFASRTLQPAQGNYAQIDKKALPIHYGVTHFQKYLLGRDKPFTLITDDSGPTTSASIAAYHCLQHSCAQVHSS